MEHKISRRALMKRGLLAGALVPALVLTGKDSQAANLTPLDGNDPAAKALAFVTDASKVDAGSEPTFKTGQHCAACAQYQGKETDSTAGCTIFSGHSVPAGGWCKVWTQRSG
jgi:hypothetical protein